jgi:sec-independent protein translocase protein TatB
MFDISWTEFLLIGVVALVVIGPKELPAVMRTMGQWTRKVRSMASDFQSQFQEAMREAEMSDLKKQVDDMARDVTQLNPLKSVRDDVESIGKEVQTSLGAPPGQAAVPAAGEIVMTEAPAEPPPAMAEAVAPAAAETAGPLSLEPSREEASREMETLGAPREPSTAEAAHEKVPQPDGSGPAE